MNPNCGFDTCNVVLSEEKGWLKSSWEILLNPRSTCPTWISFLIAVNIMVFGQVVYFDFVYYDDYVYTVEKSTRGNLWAPQFLFWAMSSTDDGFWAPITKISHRIDTHIFGNSASGHHAVNILLHILNVIILWRLLCKITGSDGFVHFLSACLFSLHPLRMEPVAWIAGRKDLLSTMFFLLMIHKYLDWNFSQRYQDYIKSFLFYLLSAMCKPISIVFPLLLPVVDFLITDKNRKGWGLSTLGKRLLPYLPFLSVSIFIFFVNLHAEQEAILPTGVLSFYQRILRIIVSFSFYLLTTFVPTGLHIPSGIEYYPFFQVETGIPVYSRYDILVFSVFIISFSLLLWFLLCRRFREGFCSFLFFSLPLVPVVGIIPFGHHLVADRFTYPAHVGLSLFFVFTLYSLRGIYKKLIFLLLIFFVFTFGIFSFLQLPVWRDGESLFRNAVAYEPNNYVALCNLGYSLVRKGRYNESIPILQKAIEIYPLRSGPYNDLAVSYHYLGRYKEAINLYLKCLEQFGDDPQVLSNIAVLYMQTGDYEKSKYYAERAIAIDRNTEKAKYVLEKVNELEKVK